MSKPKFVYVTYIRIDAGKVLKALTDTEATARFWFGNAVSSGWKVGSPVTFHRNGELVVSGKVLESIPHVGCPIPSIRSTTVPLPNSRRAWCSKSSSRSDQRTHDHFAADSKVFDKISNGWPLVLSSLKSYLEMNRIVLHAPCMTRSRPLHHDRSDTGLNTDLWQGVTVYRNSAARTHTGCSATFKLVKVIRWHDYGGGDVRPFQT